MLRTLFATLGILLATTRMADADADKVLTNVQGSVHFERAGASHAIVPTAHILMQDADIAATDADSRALVTLPDSSQVTIGASTRIAMTFFNQASIASAKFVVSSGKVRFTVEHPSGAKADYRFETPTSEIAVRGTQGDIGVDGDSLTLNVYDSASDTPVEVTLRSGDRAGQVLRLTPGQSLVLSVIRGRVQSRIDSISQRLIDVFGEFGPPPRIRAARERIRNRLDARFGTPAPAGTPQATAPASPAAQVTPTSPVPQATL